MESSSSLSIAVLPGDGIGVDVMLEAVRVLRCVESSQDGLRFRLNECAAGAAEFLRNGSPLPDATFKACQEADAVLLGAMGLPDVRWPDGKEMTPQIDLREQLQLYAGLRPITLYHENDSPLKGYGAEQIDFVIVRESTEGLFSARLSQSPNEDEVCDVLQLTRLGCERVCRSAFELAAQRRKKVTLVDKANVLPSMVFFRKIFDEIASDYPNIEADYAYVDAAALFLVQRPETFDVLVTENMFGDILSDLAAGLVGGMGMAPSADIGDDCAVFQPSHGTAPDITGKGIANPIGMILSTAMMLEWLPNEMANIAGTRIRAAVTGTLANPANRTPDMGGKLTTTTLTDAVIQNMA